jgi:putative lipoic acid-binding regulatory protein
MKDDIFNFPCDYPVKIFGKKCVEFETIVCDIISKHCGKIHPNQIKKRDSKKGNYQAITVNILATSRAQLDNMNKELQEHPHIEYLL